MPANRPQLVCLTPVKDEAWILDRFLAAASIWADVIVVADQNSEDGSRELVSAHPKAVLVDNDSDAYDEVARQRLLLNAARSLVPGPRILIALDADEALTANSFREPEWSRLLDAAPGTVIRMQWVNVMTAETRAWIPKEPIVFGYVDDGAPHYGERIHTPRLPNPEGAPVLDLDAIKVLHLQYVDSERMRAKQRWYQAWERIEMPERRPIQIYRRYHHMDAIDPRERRPLERKWLDSYVADGIDLLQSSNDTAFPWDAKVLELFEKHGVEKFKRIDIWSVDWQAKAKALGKPLPGQFGDPQNSFDRRIFAWLARTQPQAERMRIRWVQRAMRVLGW